jgi:WD40 repeat protein
MKVLPRFSQSPFPMIINLSQLLARTESSDCLIYFVNCKFRYDLNEKILKTSFTDNGGEIYSLSINPIGLLASAGFDGKVRIVDIYTEK